MSDTGQQTPTTTPRVPRQRGQEQVPEATAWAGMVTFGAMMMILLGTFQTIAGLVALFDDGYYKVASSGLVVHADYTAWGWLHLVVGLVALAAGTGLMTGAMWARITGVAVAMVSAVVNLAFVAAYPVWAVMMITLDVLVIYAITAHGRELKGRAG